MGQSQQASGSAKTESSDSDDGELIAHAYAVIPGPSAGEFYAVHLEGVRAEKITRLEPNGRREPALRCAQRIENVMHKRSLKRDWGSP